MPVVTSPSVATPSERVSKRPAAIPPQAAAPGAPVSLPPDWRRNELPSRTSRPVRVRVGPSSPSRAAASRRASAAPAGRPEALAAHRHLRAPAAFQMRAHEMQRLAPDYPSEARAHRPHEPR